MGYKIRESQTQKVPYTLVIGDQELADQTVTVRKYGEQDTTTVSVQEFTDQILADVASYSRDE